MKTLFLSIIFTLSLNCGYSQLNKIDIDINNQKTFKSLSDEFIGIKVVGAGEATHGTSEFFIFKAELFKYLVLNHNFRHFGIEAQAAEANEINDYINGADKDLNDLIKSLNFWAWQTKEVKDLIEWMRAYNSENTEKIHFFGFDMQLTHNSVFKLYSFFEKTTPSELSKVKEYYQKYENPAYNFEYYKLPNNLKEENRIHIQEIYEYIKSNQSALVANSSEYEWKNALYLSQVIVESEKVFSLPYEQGDSQRDNSMATLVQQYDNQWKNAKIMLWAHNGHVTKTEKYNKRTLGMFLNDVYEFKYYSIGLLFNSGSFRAHKGNSYKVKEFNLKPAPEESILSFLKGNGSSYFFNLNKQNKTVTNLFAEPQFVYDVPANFKKKKSFTYKPFILSDNYDAIMFFDKTTSAKPINY